MKEKKLTPYELQKPSEDEIYGQGEKLGKSVLIFLGIIIAITAIVVLII